MKAKGYLFQPFRMYNAYSASGNLKETTGIVSFIIALFIAEVISKVLIIILF